MSIVTDYALKHLLFKKNKYQFIFFCKAIVIGQVKWTPTLFQCGDGGGRRVCVQTNFMTVKK